MVVVGRGGPRNRSGGAADPTSGRSERRGYSLTALPAHGYDGDLPDFPLPAATPRELEVWEHAWRTPQGWAWAQTSEQWRHLTIGLWVRTFVRCEAEGSPASLLAQLHRFADQIGMTTAGLAEMGWKVAADETSSRRATAKPDSDDEQAGATSGTRSSSRPRERRLRAAPDPEGETA